MTELKWEPLTEADLEEHREFLAAEAEQWIRTQLGPVTATDLIKRAEAEGIETQVVREALTRLIYLGEVKMTVDRRLHLVPCDEEAAQ